MDDFKKQSDIKSFYNDSSYFESHLQEFSNLQSRFQKYRIKKLLQIYTPGKDEKILDVGCGWGTFCFALAPKCKEIVGIDYSERSIELCNRLLKEKGYANVTFLNADAQNIPLKNDAYDVVICADIFEHLYPAVYEKVIDECRRLLKPGGKLLIWTPHRGHFIEILRNNDIILKRDVGHVDYKSMDYLTSTLKEKQFLIRKSYYAESHNPGLNIFEKLFQGITPLLRRRIAILAEKKD